jgi:hypothetical protein
MQIKLADESTAILQTPEDDQCCLKHRHIYTSDVEEILTFKTFKKL